MNCASSSSIFSRLQISSDGSEAASVFKLRVSLKTQSLTSGYIKSILTERLSYFNVCGSAPLSFRPLRIAL